MQITAWLVGFVNRVILYRDENGLKPFGRPALLGHIQSYFPNFNQGLLNFIAYMYDDELTERTEDKNVIPLKRNQSVAIMQSVD